MSLENKISFYNSAKDVAPAKEITIRELARIIHDGDFAEGVSLVRNATSEDEKRSAKMQLPAVQISGAVTSGDRAQAIQTGRFVHSGWLQLDIDGDGLGGRTPEEARAILGADRHVLTAFITPSGAGAKALFRIAPCPTDERHKAAFRAVEKYISQTYGMSLDPSTKDSGRLCYLSADAECTWNGSPIEFVPPAETAPKNAKSKNGFPEPPPGQGINDPWLPQAARWCETNGFTEAQAVAEIKSFEPRLRRSFVEGEVERACRTIYSTPTPPPQPFTITAAGELEGIGEAADFVEGLLTDGGASVVYGPSNTGKSFWVLDLAAAVATGRDFRDELEVEKGAVIYVALEGSHGARNRIAAMIQEGRIMEGSPLFLCFDPVSLIETGHARRMAETVATLAATCDIPCRLVIIDTLARGMAGGDENAGPDMTKAVKTVDAIRAATGAHVLLVHHCGKDEAKGARGHSSLRAAMDTEIEIIRPEGESISTARVTKQRDMPMGEPMPFSLKVIELGTDRRGRAITSCVIHHEDAIMATGRTKPGRPPAATDEELLALLPAATTAAWQKSASDELGVTKSPFHRALKRLKGTHATHTTEGWRRL